MMLKVDKQMHEKVAMIYAKLVKKIQCRGSMYKHVA